VDRISCGEVRFYILSDVRVIIAIMHVLVEELLCQAVMRRIPVLEYPLLGVGGPGSRGTYPVLENPQAWLLGARVYAEPEHEDKADWANK
jgi:hypothetical protein